MLLNNKNSTEQAPPFMTDEELMSLLNPIISPEYSVNIKDWLYYAKPNEKKGLYIISKVIKHKGEKIFRTQLTKTKEDLFNPNKLTLEDAFRRYQQKKMQSSYTDFFGGAVDDKFKYNNIFQYKNFEYLNYADFIKKEYHSYIQNWLTIEKSEQYKEFVLDFLRSFMATIRANRKFVTQYREDYQNTKPSDRFSAEPIFAERAKIQTHNPTIEEMQAKLELERQSIIEKEKAAGIVFNDQIANNEEIKKRKEELVNGQKNLLKGIYQGNMSSVYQEDYK